MADLVDGVVHNAEAHRFELIANGYLCKIDYRRIAGMLDLYHTEVPAALEGQGLASRLARAAFAHARSEGVRVRASCSYVRIWAHRHPEVADLLEA